MAGLGQRRDFGLEIAGTRERQTEKKREREREDSRVEYLLNPGVQYPLELQKKCIRSARDDGSCIHKNKINANVHCLYWNVLLRAGM